MADSEWVFTQEVMNTKNIPTAPASVKRVLSPELFSLNRSASDFSVAKNTKSKKQKLDEWLATETTAGKKPPTHRSSTGSTTLSDSVQVIATTVKAASSVVPTTRNTVHAVPTYLARGKSHRMPRISKDILPSIEDVSSLMSVNPWDCNLQLPQTHS